MIGRPVFIITIDTEGDNLWARPGRVTTANARFLPRFQQLCQNYGYKPTYLVNYEMASDPIFRSFGRGVLHAGAGEIGLHVHAWYSPPLTEPYRANMPHIYLYDLPDDVIYDKVETLTRILEDVFEVRPVSHRAGRWGFDERVAHVLAALGYLVDCSVTPGVSWRRHPGSPYGRGGPDFSGFPTEPYFLDLDDIRRPGSSPLLEVPVTIRQNAHNVGRSLFRVLRAGMLRKAVRLFFGVPHIWLRPDGRNRSALLHLVDWAVDCRLPVLEFALHSSELMPGGSPTFRTAEQIEVLYAHLASLFTHLASSGIVGATLREYRATFADRIAVSGQLSTAQAAGRG